MHADAKSACCMLAQAAAVAHWRVGHCPLQLLQLNTAIYSRKLNALKLHETSFRQYKTKPIFVSWSDHVDTAEFRRKPIRRRRVFAEQRIVLLKYIVDCILAYCDTRS